MNTQAAQILNSRKTGSIKYSLIKYCSIKSSARLTILLFALCATSATGATTPDTDRHAKSINSGQVNYKNRAAEYKIADLPSISAVLKTYHLQEPERVTTYWMQLSPTGMRVQDAQNKTEIIKNFENEQVWLVNTAKHTSHEIDISFYKQHFPNQVQFLVGPFSKSNLFGTKPCTELDGFLKGEKYWRGQVVEEWQCFTKDQLPINKQLFSHRWNIVVQVEHTSRLVEELIDINEDKFDKNSFYASSELQAVEYEEFMSGKAQLDAYSP